MLSLTALSLVVFFVYAAFVFGVHQLFKPRTAYLHSEAHITTPHGVVTAEISEYESQESFIKRARKCGIYGAKDVNGQYGWIAPETVQFIHFQS